MHIVDVFRFVSSHHRCSSHSVLYLAALTTLVYQLVNLRPFLGPVYGTFAVCSLLTLVFSAGLLLAYLGRFLIFNEFWLVIYCLSGLWGTVQRRQPASSKHVSAINLKLARKTSHLCGGQRGCLQLSQQQREIAPHRQMYPSSLMLVAAAAEDGGERLSYCTNSQPPSSTGQDDNKKYARADAASCERSGPIASTARASVT
jgi:hypothetical protein